VLVLSAYDATSHRLWRERLAALFPEYAWTQLSLPPRHFDWRVRSNSLHWGLSDAPQLDADYDLLLATSMVDLAALRGLRPALAGIPTAVYFHENQFFYPANDHADARRRQNIEPMLVPVYSALCADAIVFNSTFNRSTFLSGLKLLFDSLPDALPDAAWQRLQRSVVIPVPVALEPPAPSTLSASADILEVLWNHRWEYDKGPRLLLAVLQALQQQNVPVRLHLAGQQFRQQPEEFAQIVRLAAELSKARQLAPGQSGFVEDPANYQQLMDQCDVVLSTADHDFQGLGVQEAALRGCSPLVPDDLAYPEYLPEHCRYPRLETVSATAAGVARRLAALYKLKQIGQPLPLPDLGSYCGAAIRQQYQDCFSSLAGKRGTV
jgi:glycosyltransferase involved in cell wall biosynthesis